MQIAVCNSMNQSMCYFIEMQLRYTFKEEKNEQVTANGQKVEIKKLKYQVASDCVEVSNFMKTFDR